MFIKKIANVGAIVAKVIDNFLSTSATDALSAGKGKELYDLINSLTSRVTNIENSMYKTGVACPDNNANNALSDGCYYYVDTTTNRPTGTSYGTIFTMVSASLTGNNTDNWVNQIGMSTGNTMHFRQKVNAGPWTAWQTISKS